MSINEGQASPSSMASPKIEVLLVDDDPDVRCLLREMIETYEDLTIVGEATDGEEAILLSAKLKPSVVIMDVQLPGLNGVQSTTLIRLKSPFTAVIALTVDPLGHEKAMRIAGAAAIVNKAEVFRALYPAIINAVKLVKHPT
jgi:DNA-binding NarL/FixJ family response regulator